MKDLRRYLQIASISDNGVLIQRKPNPYGRDYELIIVPCSLAAGLISALHLRLNHPKRTQFKKIWNRYFFAIDGENLIDECTKSCSLCTSLQKLPKELFHQSSSEVPTSIGTHFSADIIRREKQLIFIMLENFSNFTVGHIIPNEQHQTLRESLIQLSASYKHFNGCVVRVDNAPGFLALRSDRWLQSLGITLDFGRIKNKNQNPCVDRTIQDVESEIVRMSPNGGKISAGTLALAISAVNSRIRSNGLSSREVLFKRDIFTNENLNFHDDNISKFKHEKRLQNHPSSELSKSGGKPPAERIVLSVGDIVHVKSDGTKHKAREFYLVTAVDQDSGEAEIQKFCGNQLRAKKYTVKIEEVYLAAGNFMTSNTRGLDQKNDSEISIYNEVPVNTDDSDDRENRNQIQLRKSTRNREKPDWLATSEISRLENISSSSDSE